MLELHEVYDDGAMLSWSDDASREAGLWVFAEVVQRAVGVEVERMAMRGLIGDPISATSVETFARLAPELIQYDYRAYHFDVFLNDVKVATAGPLDQGLRGVHFTLVDAKNIYDLLPAVFDEAEQRFGVEIDRGVWYGGAPPDPRVQTPVFPVMTLTMAGLVGWVMHRIWPRPIAEYPIYAVAEALVAVAVLLIAWGLATLWRAGTAVEPNGETKVLVTHGPFRFSRNPIYIAQALVILAAAFFFNTWWIVVTLGLWFVVINNVAAREELYLRQRFPEYGEYEKRVRRWI